MKDYFSTASDQYVKYRPQYSADLVSFIVSHCAHRGAAWDVGTGNGQLAIQLATHFQEVFATDISSSQIANAPKKANVVYSVQPAEQTNFDNQQFDLVTVAQAIHWFDFEKFYKEVKRTLKPEGVFVALGYGLSKIDGMDDHLHEFYHSKIGSYWDAARMIVQNEYQTIPFPFEDLGTSHFQMLNQWSFVDFIGYLKTWSAVKTYEKTNGTNPVDEFIPRFKIAWGDDQQKRVVTPVFVRTGKFS